LTLRLTLSWGIIGVGRAGRARAAAIEADPRACLVATFRGARLPDVQRVESTAALIDAVDAVAICSPDDTHAPLVAQALAAGRHVLCEFPLALSATRARALVALAEQQNRTLHVAHIALLSSTAAWLRARCSHQPVRSGVLRFTSAPQPGQGSIAHANISRLHRLCDLMGLPSGVSSLTHIPASETLPDRSLSARLKFASGVIDLDLRQSPGASRRLEMVLTLDSGTVMILGRSLLWNGIPQALPPAKGLFLRDQQVATATILDGTPGIVGHERLVGVLELADRLMSGEVGPPIRS